MQALTVVREKIRLPRLATPYVPIVEDLDVYRSELAGAVDVLRSAQDAKGDARMILMDLAADAWHAARRAARISSDAFAIERLVDLENEVMTPAEITPVTYLELGRVYSLKMLATVRMALAVLGRHE